MAVGHSQPERSRVTSELQALQAEIRSSTTEDAMLVPLDAGAGALIGSPDRTSTLKCEIQGIEIIGLVSHKEG